MQLKSRIVRWGQYVVCKCFWHRAKSVCLLLLALESIEIHRVLITFAFSEFHSTKTRNRLESNNGGETSAGPTAGRKCTWIFSKCSRSWSRLVFRFCNTRGNDRDDMSAALRPAVATQRAARTRPLLAKDRELVCPCVSFARHDRRLVFWARRGLRRATILNTAGAATACLRNNETANQANKNV